MPRCPRRPAPHRAVVIPFVLAVLVAAGCSKPYDGVSDYDREMQAKQAAADAAKSQGLKMTEKTYPLGKAWVVDMKGMTVADDHIQKLKDAGRVAELDLSKSTVTDAHLAPDARERRRDDTVPARPHRHRGDRRRVGEAGGASLPRQPEGDGHQGYGGRGGPVQEGPPRQSADPAAVPERDRDTVRGFKSGFGV